MTIGEILLRLSLLSFGSTQAWNASGGHSGEPDDKIVAIVAAGEDFPHLRWRAEYERAENDGERERVRVAAKVELDAWVKRSGGVSGGKTDREIVLEDGEGFEPAVVSQRFGMTPSIVRKWRLADGRDPESGAKPKPQPGGSLSERAVELRGKGMTTRQIALALDVHQTQVMRWTRRSAA